MSDCDCEIEIKNKEESRVLVRLLSINAIMFFVEITLGIISESTALIADSLDMLAACDRLRNWFVCSWERSICKN